MKDKLTNLTNTSNVDDQFLISYLLKLTTIKEELLDRDPMLPPDFLPGSWIGGDVLALIDDQLNTLTSLLQASSFKMNN
ncbi:PaaX family transcriptional regulator C-terminal domain-containing protein [Alkalihalobacillus sp. NPDC078783]